MCVIQSTLALMIAVAPAGCASLSQDHAGTPRTALCRVAGSDRISNVPLSCLSLALMAGMPTPGDRLDDDFDLRRFRVAEYVRERFLNDPQHRALLA
jgi:hypothetical protein